MRVEPETDPGDDDQHAAGHVDGDEIVGELSLEDQVDRETAVFAWKMDQRAEGEKWKFGTQSITFPSSQ